MPKPIEEMAPAEGAAVVRQMAAQRQAAKSATESRLTAIVPMPDDDQQAAEAMRVDDLLSEIAAQIEPVEETTLKQLDEVYLVFVKCRNTHRHGQPAHGLYLKSYPTSLEVDWDQWRTRYKTPFEKPYYQLEVPCQVCAMNDLIVPLPVSKTSDRGDIRVEPRWLWRRPKDPARAAIEGETRVFSLSHSTSNMGRDEALARVEAHLREHPELAKDPKWSVIRHG